MTITESCIRRILEMCKKNDRIAKLKCGTLSARATIGELEALAEELKKNIQLSEHTKLQLKSSISYGHGFFPKIPWLAFVTEGRKVSNSISVCLCFDRSGKGIVLGTMSYKQHIGQNYKTIYRSEDELTKVPLIKGSIHSNYGNKFFNPLTQSIDELSEKIIFEHIKNSIKLMSQITQKEDPYIFKQNG